MEQGEEVSGRLLGVALVLEGVPLSSGPSPIAEAVARLRSSLGTHGLAVVDAPSIGDAPRDHACLVIAGPTSALARAARFGADVEVPREPGVLALLPTTFGDRPLLVATGTDARGLLGALTILAERVEGTDDPLTVFRPTSPRVERHA